MSKKELAISFLKMAASGKVREAYDKFISPDFTHHNQYFKGDRQSLMLAMEEAHRKSPNKAIEVKRVFEDQDTVLTYSRVVRQSPGDLDIVAVHIMKFKNDLVVEMWDVGQQISKDSPNENGVF